MISHSGVLCDFCKALVFSEAKLVEPNALKSSRLQYIFHRMSLDAIIDKMKLNSYHFVHDIEGR